MQSDKVWQVQRTIRKNSLVLPCAILIVAGLLVVAYHVLFEKDGGDMHTFLIVVMLTMFPLAYLDANISRCSEPLAIFNKFALKVMVMQLAFLCVRAITLSTSDRIQDMYGNKVNMLTTLVGCIAIPWGFHHQLPTFLQQTDVLMLIGMAFCGALVTLFIGNVADGIFIFEVHAVDLSSLFSDYIEVVAFVPAALTVFTLNKKDAYLGKIEPDEHKRTSIAFAVFVIGFYFVEDIVTAFLTIRASGFEAVAHVLHFLLLLDVAWFLIASAHDPEQKGRDTMLTRFGDVLFPDHLDV